MTSFFLIILLLQNLLYQHTMPTPKHSEEYFYNSNGFKIKIGISEADSNMQVVYTLYNTSMNDIYYSPRCLIVDNFPRTITIEFGAYANSIYMSDQSVLLAKLHSLDSVSISEKSKVSNFKKKISIAFDCIVFNKMSESSGLKFLKHLPSNLKYKEAFNLDYYTYSDCQKDWFSFELPALENDK